MDNASKTYNTGSGSSFDENTKNLVPVEAAYFYPGMMADFSIYIKTGPNFSLLCSHVRLTDFVIKRIDAAEDAGNLICVNPADYKNIIVNAAKIAASQGTSVNWENINHAAENPLSVEDFLQEKEAAFSYDTELPIFGVKQPQRQNEPAASTESEKVTLIHAENGSNATGSTPASNETFRSTVPVEEQLPVQKNTTENKTITNPEPQPKPVLAPEKKPVLKTAVQRIIEYKSLCSSVSSLLASSERNYIVSLDTVNDLAESIVTLVRTSDADIIMQCMSGLRNNGEYLVTHTLNVSTMNVLTALWLGMKNVRLNELAMVGLLHDMGMQQISGKILTKPSKLSSEEYNIIKQHVVHSHNIAVASGISNASVLAGIKQHHERSDGTGYPEGQSSSEISMYAKLTAVSDIYDAMVTGKPYRENFSPLDALDEFSQIRHTNIDTKLMDIILDHMSTVFINKSVLLSNGRTARIASINPSDYAHPAVICGEDYIKTSQELKIVSIDNFIF